MPHFTKITLCHGSFFVNFLEIVRLTFKRNNYSRLLLSPWKKATHSILKLNTAQKMEFSIKHFFSKSDQIPQFPENLFTFTEEILNGKLHFLCSVSLCENSSNKRDKLSPALVISRGTAQKVVCFKTLSTIYDRNHSQKLIKSHYYFRKRTLSQMSSRVLNTPLSLVQRCFTQQRLSRKQQLTEDFFHRFFYNGLSPNAFN